MKINFIPTRRLVFILLLGTIPLFLGGPWIKPFMIFLVYNLIFLTLAVVDYFFISNFIIRVKRIVKDTFSLGIKNSVKISLSNKNSFSLFLQLKDDYPFQFKADRDNLFRLYLSPDSTEEIEYFLTPYERGKYNFGKMHIRCYSFLGLTGRRIVVEQRQKVRVYPNLDNVTRYQLMAIKGHLQRTGIKPAKILGRGMEFESLRDYLPDDEYSDINWKASARRGRLIVNQYDEEKSQNILILIDAGRMMTSCVGGISKLDYAVNTALILSYVCSLRGDKIGLLAFAGDIKSYLPPSKGKKHIQLILETLYDLTPELVEPNYSLALKFLGTKSRKRSLVFLFSDIMDQYSSEELIKYFPTLFPHHIPFCVAITDPVIREMATKDCTASREIYEQAMAEQVLWERKKALSIMGKKGVYTMEALPEELSVKVINEYLKIKVKAKL
ncbi:MAG: hypothetical protein BWY64_02602 [bacterium ADurb.Bin363]|nr:MAG: hypothetical protein BWY64_02602 [bacterium ADurb.Bin363]